ncbi:MAG: hypothetical protein GTO02_18230 [Candidatus Dadabacteria bacterium]|nr:hypothetical protein [Candidatus Dadabacteria bacterium]
MEIVEAVNLIYEENNKPVLVKDLETKFNKSKKTISRWLKPALEHGWIENVGEDGRGKPFKLVPGKFEKQKFDFLPSVSKLAAKWGRTDIEDFSVINPITGKRIKLKKQKKHKK